MCYQLAYLVKEICKIFSIKKTIVYKTLQCQQVYDILIIPNRQKAACCWLLTSVDIGFIRSLLSLNHTIHLGKIQEQLLSQHNVQVPVSNISRTLHQLHINNKDVSGQSLECNIEDQAVYINKIADLAPDPNMLMFGDEASKDKRTSARRCDWSEQGMRCIQRKFFVCGCVIPFCQYWPLMVSSHITLLRAW